jgi:uncharacterized protein YegL
LAPLSFVLPFPSLLLEGSFMPNFVSKALQRFSETPEVSTTRRAARSAVFVIDTSGSVRHHAKGDSQPKATRFTEGLTIAQRVFEAEPVFSRIGEIATIRFNSQVFVDDFRPVSEWTPPECVPSGYTHTAAALRSAMDLVSARLQEHNRAGIKVDTPNIVLISDGYPEGEDDSIVEQTFAQARDFESKGFAQFLTMGVEDFDRTHLAKMRFKNKPIIIQDTNWETAFRWVSMRVSGGPGQRPISLGL